MPATQLGRVEHDPDRDDLATGRPDGDHRDGTAGAAKGQPGTAVDGLDGQLGVRLPAKQDRAQLGDVLRAM
jgi:hypothetical protein